MGKEGMYGSFLFFNVFVIRGYLLVLDHLYYISSFNKFSFCGFLFILYLQFGFGGEEVNWNQLEMIV